MALTTSLEGYWSMDEASDTNRADSSGNGRTAADNGTVNAGTGIISNAATAWSDANFLSVTDNDVFDCAGTGAFSISLWIKTSAWTASSMNMLSKMNAANNAGWRFYLQSNGGAPVFQTNAANNHIGTQSSATGVWNHWVVTRAASGNITFYKDGNLDTAGAAYTAATANTDSMRFGMTQGESRPMNTNALIDETGFWTKELTANEVAMLYNAGRANAYPLSEGLATSLISYWKLDESSGNAADAIGSNTLTNNGTTTYVAAVINNGADFESGSSQYLSIADNASLSLTGTFSIACWVNFESLPAFDSNFGIVTKAPTSAANGYALTFNQSDGSVYRWRLFSGASQVLVHNYTPSLSTWIYAVWTTSSGDGTRFYINGTEVTTASHVNPTDNATQFSLGAWNNVSFFDGKMDEVGIWSRVLSASEVTQLYNSGAGLAYPFTASSGAVRDARKLNLMGAG